MTKLKDQISRVTVNPNSPAGTSVLSEVASNNIEIKIAPKVKLFVYGTLMRDQGSVMKGRFIREAELPNHDLYIVSWFPGVVRGSGIVRGEIFEIDESDLDRLDRYEGVPHLYRRLRTKIDQDDVYYYHYNGNVEGLQHVPSGSFKDAH